MKSSVKLKGKPLAPLDRLPQEARRKFRRLQAQAIEARDMHSVLTKRVNETVQRMHMGEEAASDPELQEIAARARESQTKAREADASWRDLLQRLSYAIDSWAVTGESITLYQSPDSRLRLDDNRPAKQKVDEQRELIATIKHELRQAKAAPLPVAERLKSARQYLETEVAKAKPMMRLGQDGSASITLGPGVDASIDHAAARRVFFAAVSLIGVDKALKSMAPDVAELPGELSIADRRRRIDDLSRKLLAAEREEERLIEQAAKDGIAILRRTDASPAAILGLVIGEKPAR